MHSPLSRWLRGAPPAPNPARPSRETESAVSAALAEAPRTFLRDGFHASIALLIRGRQAFPVVFDPASDDSRDALRGLARRVDAEAAVTISEAWLTDIKTDARSEALIAVVERAGRPSEAFFWPVVRGGDRPPGLGARKRYDALALEHARVLDAPPPRGEN